jgi:hypothetical protein
VTQVVNTEGGGEVELAQDVFSGELSYQLWTVEYLISESKKEGDSAAMEYTWKGMRGLQLSVLCRKFCLRLGYLVRTDYVKSPRPTGSGAHPSSYPMGTGGSFPGGKEIGAWSWLLTSISYRDKECVELHLHFTGVVLSRAQGQTLPLPIRKTVYRVAMKSPEWYYCNHTHILTAYWRGSPSKYTTPLEQLRT